MNTFCKAISDSGLSFSDIGKMTTMISKAVVSAHKNNVMIDDLTGKGICVIDLDTVMPGLVMNDFGDSILKYIRPQEECYFIHSFEAKPTSYNNRLADTEYGGRRVCAVVQNGNVFGTQFHPEKSGKVGLNIIRAFCEL